MTRNSLLFTIGLVVIMAGWWLAPRIAPRATRSQDNRTQAELAQLPRLTIEATVTNLFLDTNTSCENTCPAREYPLDKATIRVNQILEIDNPSKLDTNEIQVGKDVPVLFTYSARPAAITYRAATPTVVSTDPNTTVSHTVDNSPALVSGGVVKYAITSINPKPTVSLSGVKAGDTIRATLDYGFAGNHLIGEYELVK